MWRRPRRPYSPLRRQTRRSDRGVRVTVEQDTRLFNDPSSSPPSPRDLLATAGLRQHRMKREPSPAASGYLTLPSPSSSTAGALISGPSSSGPRRSSPDDDDDVLQFCDTCYAAIPAAKFSDHTCLSSP